MRKPVIGFAISATVFVAGCGYVPFLNRSNAVGAEVPARVPAVFPETWRFQAGRAATFAGQGMVASNNLPGSEAGAEILRAGGNAVDAAVATGFALAVAFPEAGNLGGGGFMVIRMADGRTDALDYRETAPRQANRNMFLDAAGNATDASFTGRLGSAVPGSIAGLSEALRRYGSMSLAQVIAPAVRMAETGVIVDSTFQAVLKKYRNRISGFGGAALFLPHGEVPAIGTVLRQPELAETLRLIARDGPAAFYKGRIADRIVEEMGRDCVVSAPGMAISGQQRCGIITRRDIADYRAVWRRPIRSTYRGYALLTMPPSSSGGITVAETLNILEGFDTLPAFNSARYKHLVREAFQRAFIDRNSELGDPDFVAIPMVRLTSKTYAEGLRKGIDSITARPSPTSRPAMREGTETTAYSAVDRWGNAASTTTTLNNLFGSGVYVRGAGFFLNSEMADFSTQPGSANQFGLVEGEINAVAPGKRMLSAMSPTIILNPRGELFLIVGARGGPRIITVVSQVILNVIDHKMTLADAMTAPRLHHQWLPDLMYYEAGGFTPDVAARLDLTGHNLRALEPNSGIAAGIMRVRGGWEGMDDPRSNGGAVGY